jgi:N-acetylneuraminic acid mutarotase
VSARREIDAGSWPHWLAVVALAICIALSQHPRPAGAQEVCFCPGDCNVDCTTTRSELELAVHAIFDPPFADCDAADADASASVTAPDLLLIATAIREPHPRCWVTLAPLQEGPRQEVGVAAIGNTIYVIGGFDGVGRVEAYDVPTNEWATVANLPQPRNHIGAAAIDGFVYSVGGFVGNGFTPADEVYRYDPERDSWREMAPLPTRRGALAVAAVDGLLYAVAGNGPAGNVTRHDVYDPGTDEWTELPPFPSPLNHLAAAGFEGRLYVVGGRSDGGGTNNSAALRRYDPSTQQWESLTPMPTARSGLAAAVLNRRLVVVGGEVNPADPDGVFPQVEVYDFATDTWESLDPMAVPRHGIGAAAVGDLLYVPGGAVRAGFGATEHHDALRIF